MRIRRRLERRAGGMFPVRSEARLHRISTRSRDLAVKIDSGCRAMLAGVAA